jgi:uncharacterized protein (DUF934 family)
MSHTINLIAARADNTASKSFNVLQISNDTEVHSAAPDLSKVDIIELHFPKFTDGRAYSQAVQLRRRHAYQGDIRATGEVLIDQLAQMQRTGFSSAVLRDDQDIEHGRKLLAQFNGFYQGDAVQPKPAFTHPATAQIHLAKVPA